jgi:hypothetical protein
MQQCYHTGNSWRCQEGALPRVYELDDTLYVAGGATPDGQCLGSVQAYDLNAIPTDGPPNLKWCACFDNSGHTPHSGDTAVIGAVSADPGNAQTHPLVVVGEGPYIAVIDTSTIPVQVQYYQDPNYIPGQTLPQFVGAASISHGAIYIGDEISTTTISYGYLFSLVPAGP